MIDFSDERAEADSWMRIHDLLYLLLHIALDDALTFVYCDPVRCKTA
jgi:hypothetical protein